MDDGSALKSRSMRHKACSFRIMLASFELEGAGVELVILALLL